MKARDVCLSFRAVPLGCFESRLVLVGEERLYGVDTRTLAVEWTVDATRDGGAVLAGELTYHASPGETTKIKQRRTLNGELLNELALPNRMSTWDEIDQSTPEQRRVAAQILGFTGQKGPPWRGESILCSGYDRLLVSVAGLGRSEVLCFTVANARPPEFHCRFGLPPRFEPRAVGGRGELVFLACQDEAILACSLLTGQEIWRRPGGRIHSVGPDYLLTVPDSERNVVEVVSTDTGEQPDSFVFGFSPLAVLAADSMVVVAGSEEVAGVRAGETSPTWSLSLSVRAAAAFGPYVVVAHGHDPDQIDLTTDVSRINAVTGQVEWTRRLPRPVRHSASLSCIEGGGVLCAYDEENTHIVRFEFA